MSLSDQNADTSDSAVLLTFGVAMRHELGSPSFARAHLLSGATMSLFTRSAVRMARLPKQKLLWHITQTHEHQTISTKPVICMVPNHQKGSNRILRVLQTSKDNSHGSF